MEETEKLDPEFVKGFNEGYILKKYLSVSIEIPSNSLNDSDRSLGFQSGMQEAVMEKERNYPSWLRRKRLDAFDKDDGSEKDIEHDKE